MGSPEARLREVHDLVANAGERMAVFLVYERPSAVDARPALARTFFAERCSTDHSLTQIVESFRSIGAYVEVFQGEQDFIEALATGRLDSLGRPVKFIYPSIGFGITDGGFEPGRMALIPALADSYGLTCANSDAYTCAMAMHRYHSFVLLRALGVEIPPVWFFRRQEGWLGDRPINGTKVIVKSTYEAWSVGVTERSVFEMADDSDSIIADIASEIGQPVTVQQFVPGREVCQPVISARDLIPVPCVEQILSKAPGDPDAFLTIDDNLSDGSFVYEPFAADEPLLDELHRRANEVFRTFQQRSFGRMDFRIDAAGKPWLTDAAVTPSLSDDGSAFRSLELLGFSHPEFLRIVAGASLISQGALVP